MKNLPKFRPPDLLAATMPASAALTWASAAVTRAFATAATTGVGAVIGAIAGGAKGAGVGAATGGGAGTGVVLATKGKEIRYGPETRLNFTLTNSVEI